MGNYRDFMSRTECLLNALVWSLIPVLQIIFLLIYGPALETSSMAFAGLLLLMELAAGAFHWYRYLVYNKKRSQNCILN